VFSFLDISSLDTEAKLCLESSSSDYPVTQRSTPEGQDPVHIAAKYIVYKTLRRTIYKNLTSCHVI